MLDYNKQAVQRKMQALTTIHEYEQGQDVDVQAANSKLASARAQLEREQQKLDQTPRVINGKHNQRYGAQLNIRDQAKEVVSLTEEALVKAQNDFSRKRYLARLDAERKAQAQEQANQQQEHAKEQEASFKASARTRWLASGGTEQTFEENADSLWTEEVKRRSQSAQPSTAVAQIQAKIRGAL
jgi:hypothetical protein